MSTDASGPLTRVYIDGYNLYYGCLKRSHDKWLNPLALIDHVIRTSFSSDDGAPRPYRLAPLALKFFTAPILPKLAKANDSLACQTAYHQALAGHLGDAIQVIKGYYDLRPVRARQVIEGVDIPDSPLIDIWKVEEKQSDVSLALHAYRDVVKGDVGHVVIVSNDTDMAPCFQMIKNEGAATLGLVVPTRHRQRSPNGDLSRLADWTRSSILDSELAAAHLPNMVRWNDKAVHRPISWYPRPDLLEPILIEATRVRRSRGGALKWLNSAQAHLGGRVPIEMTSTEEEADELRAYMDRYADDFGLKVARF
ncbi:NYN domain-containing protein [Luteibacter sp. 9135]|uniref:NYN domain-containing protein n=1 Tax=Luteibacter sp. 9135 TaxID=1500893 RepID=UPI000560A086|nr:antitoxin Xre/MbcA/ParS toxin-binding domain-containing protein [Luteibacter sp. 9135]